MKILRTVFFALFLFGLLAAPPAQAQTPWELGPHLAVNLENDELLVGAIARIHLSALPITLNPGIEFYPSLGTDISLLVLNFDVQYQLGAESVEPYVGGGISMARLSVFGVSDWETGLNLKGGLLFKPASRTQPYVEAVANFAGNTEALIFKAGFLFAIGG